ncbi:MAG TPA: hypothetical protein EYN66_20940, partial [Myxococcales bacterium]|nr:hypothetical protein [Myxococcales bacterium]
MQLRILALWLAALCFTACGDAGEADSAPADPDIQDALVQNDVPDSESEIAVPDSEDIPDTPEVDERIEPTPSALILDFDMSPSIAWYIVMESLQQQGFQVTYRRWFPHTVLSDTEGQSAYSMILVGAGQGPTHPTEIMRVDDANRLTAYVQGGGTLVLLPRHTWQDASVSDAAWLHMNRILEGVNLPLRIQRNTVVGSVSTDNPPKPPLHITTQAAYPGALEWTINLPVGYAATEHPAFSENPIAFAAGYVPTLACDSDDVAVFATVHQDSILWKHHGPEGIEFPEAPPPVAALSPAGNGGWLAVIPRSFATLSSYSGTPGDRPILFLDLLNRLDTNMDFFLKHIVEVQNDGAKHAPQGCHAGPTPLFSATAPNMPALGYGPPQKALHPPVSRPIPETLPSPPVWAEN